MNTLQPRSSKKRGSQCKARSPTKKKKTQQRLPAVVIGSYAASIALNKASRAPRDVDIVCTRTKLDELDAVIGAAYNADNCPLREERHKGAKIFYTFEGGARLPIEVELVSDSHTNAGHTSLDLLHWAFAAKNRKDPEWKEKEIFPGFIAICCPLRVLMAIKRSHLIFELQWQKHIRDYHYMRAKFQKLDDAIPSDDALDAFINRRRREIKIRLGDKGKDKIHLDVPNEEFFKVHYLKAMTSQRLLETRLNEGASIYEHDELHTLLAVGSHPVYTSMKHDASKAMLEKELFDAADHTTKLNLVREEAMAIAAERIVVPALLKLPASTPAVEAVDAVDDAEAYSLGLQMTLTRLSKGWFRTFGLDHWPEVSECPFAGMGTGMARKIVEDSRIIFDGKPVSWPPCDKNNCYSINFRSQASKINSGGNTTKRHKHNAHIQKLQKVFSNVPVVPPYNVGDIVMHDTLSYIDYNVSESLLLYARSQDRVQFSPRQEIEDWGNPRMPRGWYDAKGTGFCDDYGRFVNVGEYQFDGEDNNLKEAIDTFRSYSAQYRSHPEDFDNKWKWCVTYAGRSKNRILDKPPEDIQNMFDTMRTQWIKQNKPKRSIYVHQRHHFWLKPPRLPTTNTRNVDIASKIIDGIIVTDGCLRIPHPSLKYDGKDKLLSIDVCMRRKQDIAQNRYYNMNTKTQKILRSFDIESSTKALVAKESKDVNSIARQHILKTLNIAQRLAARKLTWSPELHSEFPEDIRANVFHLAL